MARTTSLPSSPILDASGAYTRPRALLSRSRTSTSPMREIPQPSKTQAARFLHPSVGGYLPCPAESTTEPIRKLPQEINRTVNRHYCRGERLALLTAPRQNPRAIAKTPQDKQEEADVTAASHQAAGRVVGDADPLLDCAARQMEDELRAG